MHDLCAKKSIIIPKTVHKRKRHHRLAIIFIPNQLCSSQRFNTLPPFASAIVSKIAHLTTLSATEIGSNRSSSVLTIGHGRGRGRYSRGGQPPRKLGCSGRPVPAGAVQRRRRGQESRAAAGQSRVAARRE